MKKIITYSLLTAITLLSACRKEDNPNVPTLQRVPLVSVTADPTADLTISATNPATFNGKFKVDLFFKDDIKPTKVDIVVIKNGVASSVKVFNAGLTTFPTTLTVTGAQLTSLFGTAPVLSDQFDFGADIYTQDGKKYEAFPAVGVSYGAGVAGQYGGISVLATYKSVCKFTAAEYAGMFKITVDPWQDYLPGITQVVVTVVNASTLSIPSPLTGNPITLNVNTVTNEVTVNSPGYGNYGDGPITVVSRGGASRNFVSPCVFQIDLALDYTLPTLGAQYGGGPYVLRLVKL